MAGRSGRARFAGVPAAADEDQGSRYVRLELVLHPGDPVVGSVRASDGDEREFTGWLDLLVALETALASSSTSTSDKSEDVHRPD